MQRLMPERLRAMLRAESTVRFELPAEAVRDSRRRVRVAAAMGAAAYAVFLAFELSGSAGGTSVERAIDLTHDLLGLGLCALLLAAAMLRPLPDRVVLALALGLEVLLCALISFAISRGGYLRTQHLNALTWVVPVVILFPLLVPTAPRATLLISSLCTLTTPFSYWVLASRGTIVAQPEDYWHAVLTGGVAVGIAAIASRTVYGGHRQAAAMRRIGSYELLEPLGHGGMGEVWKARHVFLARPAAVKLIRPAQLQGPREARAAVNERFTREARVTASLRSPHTVELFDFGESTDGTLYYAMELLEGMNAEHFVYRFGPIEPRRAVSWLMQACHSLGEAHARHLVHRDIKPGNIMLCRYGRDRDFVKVLDFGLTRPVDAPTDTALTGTGVCVGTPGYMAPEQLFGLPIEPRSDLYALGCVAYFLLAGVRPFEAETAGELLRQHAQTAPPPLSRHAAQPVPEPLETLIMACLSKDPNGRPADADRVCEALRSSIDGEPWTEADAQEWWDRNLTEL